MKDNENTKYIEDYSISEDAKYGGLEVNNLKEALDYFNMNTIIQIKNKEEEDLNQKIESDYHNTYYKGNGEYGFRSFKPGQMRCITPEEAEQWYQESLKLKS